MIKKVLIKSICITMSLLFLVFAVIFALLYSSIKRINEHEIEFTINSVLRHYTSTHEVSSNQAFIADVYIDPKGNYHVNYYLSADSYISQEQIDLVIDAVVNNPYSSGSIGNIYYKVSPETSYFLVIGTDVNQQINIFNQSILKMSTILIIAYFGLLLIAVPLYVMIFKPIKVALDKQKEFISNASHELKTPLTIISANTDVLRQNDENSVWVNNITSQAQRMEFLIQDFLELAKMDEGKLPLSVVKFNLSEVIINTALPFDAVAFEKGKSLNLFVQPNVLYNGDTNSVKKMINILVDNAIKHASDNGEINIYLKKENGKISLTVYNTGSNVSEKDVDKIFERFYRGDNSRSRESGGSGLGLSIAKSIAECNKWKISANCKLNEFMAITIIF